MKYRVCWSQEKPLLPNKDLFFRGRILGSIKKLANRIFSINSNGKIFTVNMIWNKIGKFLEILFRNNSNFSINSILNYILIFF